MKAAAALVLLFAAPAAAEAPRLSLPVACVLGADCYIQHFLDRDPGSGVADHACGSASYDGHDGTDFALPTLAAMAAGVAVLAAAPGTVSASRDGQADGAYLTGEDVAGRECGNGVVIDHGAGWQSQYCHLATGSVAVAPGQLVAAGAVLGQVGLSGKAEFPHLHLSLRHDGTPVDPFAPDPATACVTTPAPGLWDETIAYQPAGLLQTGLAVNPPDYAGVKAGVARASVLPAKAPQLVVWAYGWGAEAGDVVELRLTGPQGFDFTYVIPIEGTQALFYRYAGRRIPSFQGWPSGTYAATARLLRAGVELGKRQANFRVEG